jgi:hypothetical protein
MNIGGYFKLYTICNFSKLRNMPNRYHLLCILFLISAPPNFLAAQQKNFQVRIVQDDFVSIPGKQQSTISLQKKSFRIQVLLENLKGVYTYASTSDTLYKLSDEDAIPEFGRLPELTMAEEEYNKEKELLVSTEGWCYWFYDPGLSWHRFNKKIIVLDSGRVVGAKTIKQLFFLPDRRSLKLKENNEPLYLLFVAVAEEDANGKPSRELLRRKIKIEWRDEDD